MAGTERIALFGTRYKGTDIDTQLQYDTVGNPYASGSAEYYRMRLAFTPSKRLSRVEIHLSYDGFYNRDNISYRCGVLGYAPANNSTEGQQFAWSGSTAVIAIDGEFLAGVTYFAWVWSPDQALGYVNLYAYHAVGTIAAPALYAKTESGWQECRELRAKNAEGWQEGDKLLAKTSGGWQEA